MNRVLPILLGLGLAAGGCAVAGKSAPRHYRSARGPANESIRARINVPTLTVESTGSAKLRATRAPRDVQRAPAPTSVSSRSYKRVRRTGSGGSPRRVHRSVAKARPVSGQRTAPVVAKGARVPPTRLVIYQGNLVIRVFKLRDAVDLAQKLSLETGAYIQSRNNNRLVIRVPVRRFHELFARLGAVGEVANKSIAARDVTRQYFDVTHRLKAAHAVLTRLKNLLLKARNVRESLAIEREMSRLLTRIEQYKGLLRYLKHHASLSTINVYFRVKPRYSRPIRPNRRSPFGWVKGLGLWRMMRF